MDTFDTIIRRQHSEHEARQRHHEKLYTMERAQADKCLERFKAAAPKPEADPWHTKFTEHDLAAKRHAEQVAINAGGAAECMRLINAPSNRREAHIEFRRERDAAVSQEAVVARYEGMRAAMVSKLPAEQQALDEALQSVGADVLQGLDDENILGRLLPKPKGDKSTTSAASIEARVRVLEQSIARMDDLLAHERQKLADARAAEAQARAVVLAAEALMAEREHAEALSNYLPAVLKLRATREAAFGLRAELPNLAQLTDAELPGAIEIAKGAPDSEQPSTLIDRAIAKVKGR
jgi:hypothetical protein